MSPYVIERGRVYADAFEMRNDVTLRIKKKTIKKKMYAMFENMFETTFGRTVIREDVHDVIAVTRSHT